MGLSVSQYRIVFIRDHIDNVIRHAIESYPYECCGALVGDVSEDVKKVSGVYRLENRNKDRKRDRYNIDPLDIMRIETEIKGKGQEIIGFYHSHPDHPCMPSEFDRERAWQFYSYLIVAVNGSHETEFKSWRLHDDIGEFVEEIVRLED